MNQRTSQERSYSCQCLTTLYGMPKKMMNYVWKIPSRSVVFPRTWIWKEVTRNLRLQARCVPVSWREENQEAKEEERHQYTSMTVRGGQRAPDKPAAPNQLDKQEFFTQPPLAEVQANEERQRNLLQENEQRFEKLSEDQKLSRLCSEAGLRLVEIGQFFCALPSLCRDETMPRDQEGTRI